MKIRYLPLLLLPSFLFGQLTSNTVTVTASHNASVQPNQAVFSVAVTSGIDVTLDGVVGALASVGITASNLVGISNGLIGPTIGVPAPSAPAPPMLQWTFQLTVPLANTKATTTSLAALAKTIGQQNSGLSLSFALQGTQVSPQSQNCDVNGLVNNARTQAQTIAAAGALSLGPVVGLTSSTSSGLTAGCLLTVKFALAGQTAPPGPNVILITASRPGNVQPDQVLVGLSVTSATTAGLDDISGPLAAAGVTGASFTGVNTQTIYVTSPSGLAQQQSGLVWSFSLTTSLTDLKNTLAQLVTAQQNIAKQNAGLSLTFQLQQLQVSAQAQAQQTCPQAGLILDAQTQAHKVAAAAGVTVGNILSLADGGSSAVLPAYRLGSFLPGQLGTISVLLPTPVVTTSTTCSLTVQFQLL